jgi:cell division septation protein DedD
MDPRQTRAGPRSLAAADAPAAAPAQAPLQRQSAAKARPGEGSGFVVQLAAARSEAQARATFRDLRSRYAVLQGREPVILIQRKAAGNGVSYAVQVGPFGSQAEAEEMCGQLKAAGGSCFPTKN